LIWIFCRTKVAIFGTEDDLGKLDTTTHDAKKIARDLFGIMPVAELKWADSFWHLPYLVVAGSDGPKKVSSEEERREATGFGEEGERTNYCLTDNSYLLSSDFPIT